MGLNELLVATKWPQSYTVESLASFWPFLSSSSFQQPKLNRLKPGFRMASRAGPASPGKTNGGARDNGGQNRSCPRCPRRNEAHRRRFPVTGKENIGSLTGDGSPLLIPRPHHGNRGRGELGQTNQLRVLRARFSMTIQVGFADALQAVAEQGGRHVLIPLQNLAELSGVPQDIVRRLDMAFFSDPRDASLKALAEQVSRHSQH